MKIWLDDIRPMPDGFDIHVMKASEAISYLKAGNVELISLDHDLGDEANGTGYDVAKFIEEAAFNRILKPLVVRVHSANPVGISNMERAITNAEQYWRQL
jgi:hypothetical protein